jgi:phage antirepressor YoqD-like protein
MSGQLEQFRHAERTMDSREIAEVVNKDHRNVLRDIDEMFNKLEGGVLGSEHTPEEEYHRGDRTQYKYIKPSAIDTFMSRATNGATSKSLRDRFLSSYQNEQNGQTYRCYKLPYRETMILVSGYSVGLRALVIDRWMELERAELAKPAPKGSELLALAVLEAQRMIEEKDAALEIAVPKAAVYDQIASAKNLRLLSEVGKINKIGPHKIFQILADLGIIFRQRGVWVPFQDLIDAGYFEVKERVAYEDDDGATHIKQQIYVTGKGELWLAQNLFPQEALS